MIFQFSKFFSQKKIAVFILKGQGLYWEFKSIAREAMSG
jgi:hypothetical protein